MAQREPESMDFQDPQINKIQLMIDPKIIFVRTKTIGLNKKDQPAQYCRNPPNLGSGPGSVGASFRFPMMGNTRFYMGFRDFKGPSRVTKSCKSWAPGIN